MVQAAGRCGGGGRAAGRTRNRQGHARSAGARRRRVVRHRRQDRRNRRRCRAARPDHGWRRCARQSRAACRQAARSAETGIRSSVCAMPAAASPPAASSMPMPPSVRKMAAESGIDAAKVQGSGMHGQVTKGDMMAAIERAAAAPTPVAATAAAVQMRAPSPADDAAREERVHMTRLRQTIARRLKDAQNTAAMLTTFNEVDMGAVMALRNQYKELFEKKHGVKLGFMGFFVRACIQALEGNPRGQRRDRRQRYRLQELLPHRRRGRHRTRPGGAGGARRRGDVARALSKRPSTISASARATASSRSRRCRAAPSPSRTAASTAR